MRRSSFITLLLVVLSAGCADRAVAPYPHSAPPDPGKAQLASGDQFTIRVFGEADLSGDYSVGEDGSINFPYVGRIQVKGMTPTAVEKEIETKLADGYLKNPQVSILVKEWRSKKVSVIGQVTNPGTFPYSDNMSIVEAISLAGGFTAMAKKNSVLVTRKEEGEPRRLIVAVDDIGKGKAPNFFLHPGDTVFVDERIF